MASAPLQPGTLLNQRFNIVEIVGQGGMGTVYKAEHIRLHVVYAVKEIRGTGIEGTEKQQDLAACEHEAQFLVKLDHPHLPKVTDAFIENDNFYLVMQFIEGVTLDTRLSEAHGAPLDVLQSVEWGLQIADVLAYLHTQDPPIIFRDLKPSNVMIQPDGSIKLIDFGIARNFQPGASKDTSLLGSVGYSPPEQFGKGQTDQRSDVYAFGATLHHLVTGRDPALQPFKFAPAHTLNRLVPESLSHLLDMCLAIEPNLRPQSANVAAVQLLRIREEMVKQRAQAAAEQAALNAVGRSMADSMEHAATGVTPRVNGSPKAENAQRIEGRNGERNQAAPDAPKPSIRVTTASTAKAKASSSSNAPQSLWPLILLVSVILGGVGAMMLYNHAGAQKQNTTPPIVAPVVQVDTNPTPTPPVTEPPHTPETPPTTAGQNGGANLVPNVPLQPPPNDNVSLQTALLPLANETLPIAISGTVKGQMGASMQLGVYFFDSKGQPINAVDATLEYTNTQHYLCVYKTLAIASNEYSVQETLALPTRLLTGVTQSGPFTYQGILFLNGKVIGETARVPLPVAAYSNSATAPNASTAKPAASPVGSGLIEGGH